MHTETVFYAIVPPLPEATSGPSLAGTIKHFYLLDAVIPPRGTHLGGRFCGVGIGVVAPHCAVVEVQIVLFFFTSVQTVVFTYNPVKVLRIFTQGAMKLRIHVRVVVLSTAPLKVSSATDLKLLVG
jgi:hypothetical protein